MLLILFCVCSIVSCRPTDGAGRALDVKCETHNTQLHRIKGYTFGRDTMASPVWDYIRFHDFKLHPHVIPWSFSHERCKYHTRRISIDYCPVCDEEFNQQYAKFKELTEEEKEEHFMKILQRGID